MIRKLFIVGLWSLALFSGIGFAQEEAPLQTVAPSESASDSGERIYGWKFRDAPLDHILSAYADMTGRTLLRAPNLTATISLVSQTRLNREEALAALESVLAMNNISIVPMGERFAKVVQTATARQEGLAIEVGRPSAALSESDAPVSRILELENISVAEALPVLQTLIRGTGRLQPIDRTNSILATDTSGNVQRIIEVLDYLDRPAVSRVETRVYDLQYAEAATVAQRLNELIAESQAQDARRNVTVTVAQPGAATPPGVIHPPPRTVATATSDSELAERGVVTGKVKIVADERTNVLIIISPPSNFVFFDHVITVLDRPVDPE
ncbi:MAG: secretin N-terminal domain-containing protein, partial [Kiritimatiellia bacterium]|nr:secretin N-terminal domain-containing protein [Kiritimatiellia bacterium]